MKLMTDIIVEMMSSYMAQYISKPHNGWWRHKRAKHQVLVDRAVASKCKSMKVNLGTKWVSYKKSETSLQHIFINGGLGKWIEEDNYRVQFKANCPR